jgi:DNA polymerase-3 subunit epsilon
MNWLARWLGNAPALSAAQTSALQAYRALPPADGDTPHEAQRLVVVDVESTGLNLHLDRLIAIGALEVSGGVALVGQGFEVVLQQAAPSSVDNILIHGIDGATQTAGTAPADALLEFLAYAGNAPLVAYHAEFDRTMINRAAREYLGSSVANRWIDLAWLAPALYPELAAGRRALDDWTEAFGIDNSQRHNAVADACATAQLFLVLLARARNQGATRVRDLLQLEKDQRWLSR